MAVTLVSCTGNAGLIEVLEAWIYCPSTLDLNLWGQVNMVWVGRFAKVIQFASALFVILDIIGAPRLREAASSIRQRARENLDALGTRSISFWEILLFKPVSHIPWPRTVAWVAFAAICLSLLVAWLMGATWWLLALLAVLTFLSLVLVMYTSNPLMFIVVGSLFEVVLSELVLMGLLQLFALVVEKAPAWSKVLSLFVLFSGFLIDLLAT